MNRYRIDITDDEGRVLVAEWANTTEAILRLQDTITKLRRPSLQRFDASFGECPPPLIGPSPEELAAFISSVNRGTAA